MSWWKEVGRRVGLGGASDEDRSREESGSSDESTFGVTPGPRAEQPSPRSDADAPAERVIDFSDYTPPPPPPSPPRPTPVVEEDDDDLFDLELDDDDDDEDEEDDDEVDVDELEDEEAPKVDWTDAPARMGALFDGALAGPSFAASVRATPGATAATLSRAPRSMGGGVWAATTGPWGRLVALARREGGRVFYADIDASDDSYLEVPFDRLDDPTASPEDARISTSGWPTLDPATIAATLPVVEVEPPRRLQRLEIVAPQSLSRAIVRRILLTGADATHQLAVRTPLIGEPEGRRDIVAVISATSSGQSFSRNFLAGFDALPLAIACQTVGDGRAGRGRLLMNMSLRAPFAAEHVASMAPDGEIWVIGGPDEGSWRLAPFGGSVAIDELFTPDAPPQPTTPQQLGGETPGRPPQLPIRVAPRVRGPQRPEAVVIDEAELAAATPFLKAHVLAERAYIAPGSDRHLIFAAGGLEAIVPFGAALWRPGPGALFVEEGFDFEPAAPMTARETAFPPTGDVAYVLTGDGGRLAFDLRQSLPVWSLWLEAPQTSPAVVSDRMRALIEETRRSLTSPERVEAIRPPRPIARVEQRDRKELEREANRLYGAGRVVDAAEMMQQAGNFAQAARYFREAAERARE